MKRKYVAVSTGLVALIGAGAFVGPQLLGPQSSSLAKSAMTAEQPLESGTAFTFGAPTQTTRSQVGGVANAKSNDSSAKGSITDSSVGQPVEREIVAEPSNPQIFGPQISRTGQMTVDIDEGKFQDAYTVALSVATKYAGTVMSSSSSQTKLYASGETKKLNRGSIVLQVPSASLEAARLDLRALGSVSEESFYATDLTSQVVDVDARLSTLHTQEATYQTLLAQAKNLDDVLRIQQSIASTRTEIEQYEAQKNYLSTQTSQSSITMNLREVLPTAASAEPAAEPKTESILHRSLDKAGLASLTVLGGMVIVAAAAGPFVALLLLAVCFGRIVWRRRGAAAARPAMAQPLA